MEMGTTAAPGVSVGAITGLDGMRFPAGGPATGAWLSHMDAVSATNLDALVLFSGTVEGLELG